MKCRNCGRLGVYWFLKVCTDCIDWARTHNFVSTGQEIDETAYSGTIALDVAPPVQSKTTGAISVTKNQGPS